MTESIEMLRSKADRMFNKTLFSLLGALVICNTVKALLATSMFDEMTSWLIAAVIAGLFLFKPGLAVFAEAVTIFLSLGHVNALAAAAIGVVMLFFCACGRIQAVWALILPLCFLPGNVLWGWQFCVLLLGLCMLARFGTLQRCVAFGIDYSLWCLMTASDGFEKVFPFELQKAKFISMEAYPKSLNFESMFNALKAGNVTALIIAVSIYCVLAAVLMYVYAKMRIGKKTAFDVEDIFKFILAGAALAAAQFGTAKVFSLEYALPVRTIALQTAAAYLISRPFASEAIVLKLSG
ncbi:MAG: hypothetical protein IJU28_02245, partial [Clostridia bacterium]|nr:hypothetical protein [Clostridia bacterium]